MLEPVKKACDVVGGPEKLAALLGCSRQALYQWGEVPRGRVLEIEEFTGGQVTRQMLRPDIYPPEQEQKSGFSPEGVFEAVRKTTKSLSESEVAPAQLTRGESQVHVLHPRKPGDQP